MDKEAVDHNEEVGMPKQLERVSQRDRPPELNRCLPYGVYQIGEVYALS
jgi:hypothetical protein